VWVLRRTTRSDIQIGPVEKRGVSGILKLFSFNTLCVWGQQVIATDHGISEQSIDNLDILITLRPYKLARSLAGKELCSRDWFHCQTRDWFHCQTRDWFICQTRDWFHCQTRDWFHCQTRDWFHCQTRYMVFKNALFSCTFEQRNWESIWNLVSDAKTWFRGFVY